MVNNMVFNGKMIVKMFILPKLINMFNAITIKVLMEFF